MLVSAPAVPRRNSRAIGAVVLAVALHPSFAERASATGYDELRSAAVARCASIDPADYQSGLLFNPDGYRSFYVRSECVQRAAVEFRDDTLCRQVRQRWSLFSSSWGISQAHCRELVQQGIAQDRKALEETKRQYANGPVRLRDFRIERNGNGRDFDIVPVFSGGYAHGYALSFEIVTPDRPDQPVLLYRDGHFLDANSNLRLFVRQNEIRARFPRLALGTDYSVRAAVVLDVGNGGPGGYWSDAFVERVFPQRDRLQSLMKSVPF